MERKQGNRTNIIYISEIHDVVRIMSAGLAVEYSSGKGYENSGSGYGPVDMNRDYIPPCYPDGLFYCQVSFDTPPKNKPMTIINQI